ncbi:hypothetical protein RhiirB3_430384 [Rhizophagus irregularis]|nr:hypothetical protein RhiirB3_430384 [Rhizophagus irregularis]
MNSDSFPIFSEDKKRSKSKTYKRIGLHLILSTDAGELDLNNSPFLKKCKGCDKNISRKKNAKEFLIYIENENSRIIERRKEEDAIKPFEMLNNIMLKNEWLK